MNPTIRRMIHAITAPFSRGPKVDPEVNELRDEMTAQRSRHEEAKTTTRRNIVTTGNLIESYRDVDGLLFGRRGKHR